jgi:5-methylcytosine-specific restriction endonuclease McrA
LLAAHKRAHFQHIWCRTRENGAGTSRGLQKGRPALHVMKSIHMYKPRYILLLWSPVALDRERERATNLVQHSRRSSGDIWGAKRDIDITRQEEHANVYVILHTHVLLTSSSRKRSVPTYLVKNSWRSDGDMYCKKGYRHYTS